MGPKVSVRIDAGFLGFLEEPGEIVPEVWAVANRLGDHVTHFVDGHEGHNVFLHQGLVTAFALSEAEMDLFTLVHTVGGVLGIGGRLFEAIGIRLEIPGELLDLGLIRCGRFQMKFELVHLQADSGHGIGGVLLIGHVADGIHLIVDGTLDLDQGELATRHSYIAEGVGQVCSNVAHSTVWGGLSIVIKQYYP